MSAGHPVRALQRRQLATAAGGAGVRLWPDLLASTAPLAQGRQSSTSCTTSQELGYELEFATEHNSGRLRGSTAVATAKPTPLSTPSSWLACAGTPAPATTWGGASARARPVGKPSAASNATSHGRSSRRSAHPSALRHQRVDIHRGIKLAVRYHPTVLVAAINEWL
jgi:hypothetical protein